MLSKTEKAWMAGFFDGEGCATIKRYKPGHRYSPYFVPVVSISNTVRDVLELFKGEYGGGISNKGNEKHEGWSPGFSWNCPIPQIRRFLEDVQPYLRIKTSQASIVREFMKLRRGSLGWGRRLSSSELEERRRLWLEIHEFRAKGKKTKLHGFSD